MLFGFLSGGVPAFLTTPNTHPEFGWDSYRMRVPRYVKSVAFRLLQITISPT